MKRVWLSIVIAASAAACLPFAHKDPAIRVLVFNIHAGKDAAGRDNLDGIAQLIKTTAADLVLLQEVDRGTGRSGQVDQLKVLQDRTGYGGVFGRTLDCDGGQYGIAALSKDGFNFNDSVGLSVTPIQTRAAGSHEPRGAPADQPRKRIDYLFLTGSLRCASARVVETQISDHRPRLVALEGISPL
jgi:endonuclease/exonuclease/phosphatase family metal-dependent hydrolase